MQWERGPDGCNRYGRHALRFGRPWRRRLIGIVEARNRVGRVAVLANGDGVYHGLVDDIVKGGYRILSITAASVEVEDMTRRTRLTLRLSGA